ncbi:MAG TPA: hypothetical protein VMM77_07000 [Gemmatimonadaceae bacterium]|nr:hypothetical protein [Gemmatimonadaceae bacterium]
MICRFGSVLTAFLIGLVAACGSEDRPEASSSAPDTVNSSRNFFTTIDTLWVAGKDERDSAFVEPWFVAAGGGAVFVSDADKGLLAFTDSGSATWRVGGHFGPIAVLSDSTIVALRASDRHLTFFDLHGERQSFATTTGVPEAQGLCAASERSMLVAGGPARLTMVGRWGDPPVALPFPWLELRDSSSLLRQTVVASSSRRPGCVIALVVGNQFALTHGSDSVSFHPFVESIVVPAVRQTVDTAGEEITTTTAFVNRATAAESVAMDDSLVFIAFGGSTPHREGLIDIYDRASGAYRSSMRIGVRVRALAAGNGAVYVLHSNSGVPALAALRPRVP